MRGHFLKGLILLFGLCVSSYARQSALDGDWTGTLTLEGKQDAVNAHFKTVGNSTNGTIDFPITGVKDLALAEVRLDAGRVHLLWRDDAETSVFDGFLKDGFLAGAINRGEKRGRLQLIRTLTVDPKIYDQYAGLYESGRDRLILIRRSQLGLTFLDFTSGRTGLLYPSSESSFWGGPAFMIPAPPEIRINFFKDGSDKVTELKWQNGGRTRRARKLTFRREDVVFSNGQVTLSGTLVLPNTKGPYPAIVRIHGAGPADRRNGADEYYAYHGIAFLSYDKRGVGQSTGDWRTAGVEDLAEDTLAAVRLLKRHANIDSKKIGLGAGSEGGWVAPVVAARDKDVAFIILFAGPSLSVADELMNETEDLLTAYGFSGDALQRALKFRKTVNDMIRSGEALTDAGWERVQSASQTVKDEKWFPYVRPATKRDWRQQKLSLMLSFDPQSLWEKTTIPVLALYGGLDRNVPAAKNVAALERALTRAGNRDYTIVVLPKANHEGMEAIKGFLDDEETTHLSRFVPGYFERPINWILKRFKAST